MTTQTDAPNVQTIAHNTTGIEIDRYFGCWLDINQPGQTHFPLNPTNDGPYSGTLKSILELVRNQHQCLVSEIVFDPELPITPGSTPGSSDKLAQRNLSIVASANPGDVTSRRIPNTFELKPTDSKDGDWPDELMIDWGATPAGTIARVFLPTVSADDILEIAAKNYSAVRLTRTDDHTIELPVSRVSFLPIPPGSSINHVGLLTIDLPPGVRKGQAFTIVVRQITRGPKVRPIPQIDTPVAAAAVAEGPKRFVESRRVLGTFQISIPVQSMDEMLEPEQRLLSVLRWILQSLPASDRWYPAFQRYVAEIANRVRGLGGNPDLIPASPTGEWEGPKPRPGGHKPDKGQAWSGKVVGLIYDRFGDFDGFVLDTKFGDRDFKSREHEIEDLARQAWTQRIAITVFAARDEPHRPLRIILQHAPRPFQG